MNQKSMLEKLTNYYDKMLKMKDGGDAGYAVVFIREDMNEVIMPSYDFPKGIYTIISICGDGIHWKYNPK